MENIILTPIEMARKRLQIQSLDYMDSFSTNQDVKQPHVRFDPCIQLPPKRYNGIFHCIKCIILEEGNIKKTKVSPPEIPLHADWADVYGGGLKDESQSNNGILSRIKGTYQGILTLYRGFWPRYSASMILYLSNEITKEDILF